MNRTSLLAVAALLIASPALAASVTETTGVNSALGVAPNSQDFVTEAATSDIVEITASQIALQKGNDKEKAFAQQMVTDHTKTSTELKSLVGAGDIVVGSDKTPVTAPSSLDASSQKTIDKLNSESGADFSADYDALQVKAHKDAVSLFQRYADGGDNPKLKEWAAKTLPALQHHLDMAQMLGQK